MSYSVILFDLDGTLTDSGPGIRNAVAYALAALGRPVPPREALAAAGATLICESFADALPLLLGEA